MVFCSPHGLAARTSLTHHLQVLSSGPDTLGPPWFLVQVPSTFTRWLAVIAAVHIVPSALRSSDEEPPWHFSFPFTFCPSEVTSTDGSPSTHRPGFCQHLTPESHSSTPWFSHSLSCPAGGLALLPLLASCCQPHTGISVKVMVHTQHIHTGLIIYKPCISSYGNPSSSD